MPGLHVTVTDIWKQDMAMECTYQRNMFPGLIYRGKDAPVVLLCFYSGKVVVVVTIVHAFGLGST